MYITVEVFSKNIYLYMELSEILLDLFVKLYYMSTISDQIKEHCHRTASVSLFFCMFFPEL